MITPTSAPTIQRHVICDICGERYETEPEQCRVCGAEMGEFTAHTDAATG